MISDTHELKTFIFARFLRCLCLAAIPPFLCLNFIALPSPGLSLVSKEMSAFKTVLRCAFFYKLAFGVGMTQMTVERNTGVDFGRTQPGKAVCSAEERALRADSYIAVS